MKSAEEIHELYLQRKRRLSPMHQHALEVKTAYYGDITLPLPELDRTERPLVANFVFSTGEQKSMRVASTMPDIYYPSRDPGATRADKKARERRLVNLAFWDLDRMKLKMRKRARHMVYYACSPVMLRPNFDEKRPTWKTRNPLALFVPEVDTGEVCPPDAIATYPKSLAWLRKLYPEKLVAFGDVEDGTFTILEYQDDEENVLCAVGNKLVPGRVPYAQPTTEEIVVELERTPNKVGRCTLVMAGGIGLDYARGSFDGTIGMWQAMAKMMALEAIGMQRSIWPEEWLVDDPNGDGAKIITHADPLHGITGRVTGGRLETVAPQINQMGNNVIDRLERGIRIEAGIPAELGGESTSNIRTGRRGDQILSSVLDFPLQEMQEILAVSLQEENKIAVAIDKAYFPTAKSIYLSSTAGEIQYEANDLWDSDINFVRYSHAGVDAQGIVVELGQLVGTGLISRRSAMETHPLIEDVQAEFDRIAQERVGDGLLEGLGMMARDPMMTVVVAKTMKALRAKEVEIEDAVIAVHEALQEQQAAAQQQAQAAPPMALPAPEMQPGMAEPQPAIQAPPEGLSNLTSLLGQLRQTA